MPRLFFAVKTPQVLIRELEGLQHQIARSLSEQTRPPSLRPEKFQNSHCTIRFLGEVEEQRIPELERLVEASFAERAPKSFEMRLSRCGVFPTPTKARTFWIGIEPEEPFQQLRDVIDAGLQSAGFPIQHDERFHPHLTLFRFRDQYRLSRDFQFPDLSHDPSIPAEWIREVVLIDSKLLPGGPEHRVRRTFKLVS